MNLDISETVDDSSVEYLCIADEDLDDDPKTKCGEIFVSFKTYNCVLLCIFCKNEIEYYNFEDFISHVRDEHLTQEQDTKPLSPISGFAAEVIQEDDLAANKEESKYDIEAEEAFTLDLEPDGEMLAFHLNEDEEQPSDQSNEGTHSYRQCMTEVLGMYRKFIGLWHSKTMNNTSNEIKTATLSLLLEKYSTYDTDCKIDDLQNKLNGMAEHFNAEYERIKETEECPSNLWYFNDLIFLQYAHDEDISDKGFEDFNCPYCEFSAAGSKDLWNHLTKNHIKIQEMDPLTTGHTRKITQQWPEKRVLQLIDLYREHECLWNVKSNTYYNRPLKAKAYNSIIGRFNELYPFVLKDRESVKGAIRQLRDYFQRIFKKYQAADLSNSKRITFPLNKAKIFEKLLFLQNVYTPKKKHTYTCELCEIVFNKTKDLNSHMRSEHPNAIYTCDKCPLVFKSQLKLELHHKEHLRADGGTYECPICHVTYKTSDDLATHLNEHISTKSQAQICEICGANFDDRSNLLIHIRRHTNIKNYVCSVCSKGFVTSTELKSHVVVHSNERPFVCETCGLSFKYSNRLNTHRLVHGEPKYECNECDVKFFKKRHLNSHQRVHEPADAPLQRVGCDVCGSLFRNNDSLSRHRRKIHNIKVRAQLNMMVMC